MSDTLRQIFGMIGVIGCVAWLILTIDLIAFYWRQSRD